METDSLKKRVYSKCIKEEKKKLKEQKNIKKNKKNNSMNHAVLIINLHSRK